MFIAFPYHKILTNKGVTLVPKSCSWMNPPGPVGPGQQSSQDQDNESHTKLGEEGKFPLGRDCGGEI